MSRNIKQPLSILLLLICCVKAAGQDNATLKKPETGKQLVEYKPAFVVPVLAIELQEKQATTHMLTDHVLPGSLAMQHGVTINKKGYPVNMFNDTLFFICASTVFFNGFERTTAINNKITDLVKDLFFEIDYLVNHKSYSIYYIQYENDFLDKNIQNCCKKSGIEILSPHYQAMRHGIAMAIPKNYFSKNYKSLGTRWI